MKRSVQPRGVVTLSDSVQQPLRTYALAAGAVGVGVLGSARPAEAKIVYTPPQPETLPPRLRLASWRSDPRDLSIWRREDTVGATQ